MNNKRICFFISSVAHAGGTERVCVEIANKLDQLGYTVTILSMYNGSSFFSLNNTVELTSASNKKTFSKIMIPITILKLRKKITAIAPDVLVNVDSALFIYSKVATFGLKIKNIVWEHFNYNAARSSVARVISRKFAAKHGQAIVTLTRADTYVWEKLQGCKAPIITIHNPSPAIKSNLNHPLQRKQIVLSVGRLDPQKGFDRLLDAWQIVKAERVKNWKLHIVGSGDLKEELEQQLEALGLTDSVQLIPATPLIHAHYAQAAIYCLSSRYEGFPMVLLEAQAFGLPLVSFDCETGPAEIIRHNENGLLVENDDYSALAQAMITLIRDEGKRAAMGANALKNAVNYNIDIIIKDWQKLFATI